MLCALIPIFTGISSEESAQNQTISRCLDAIDSSDLFIGFLGSRYGWHMTDNSTDKLLASTFNSASVLHPWLAEYRTSSVTELEFLYGALFYPTQRKENSLILLRSTDYQPPSDCDPADFGSESDYAQKKIVALRQACQDRLSTMEYMEPHEVVDHVVRTVEQYLQRRFGSEDSGVSHLQGFCNKKLAGYSVVPEANTAVELVHSVIGDAQRFETAPSVHRANSISRASVGRLPSRLDEAPVEELPPLGAGKLLIVSGTPGSGKAALLCHVARALSKESSPPVVAQVSQIFMVVLTNHRNSSVGSHQKGALSSPVFLRNSKSKSPILEMSNSMKRACTPIFLACFVRLGSLVSEASLLPSPV